MSYIVVVKKDPAFIDKFSLGDFIEITGIDKSFFNLRHKVTGYGHGLLIYEIKESDRYGYLQEGVKIAVINKEFDYDAFFVKKIPSLLKKGVLVMDMDMTSVQIEGIDEIARALGLYDEIAKLTERAMQGHMDFDTSLKMRVALLKGGSADVLEKVKEIMVETDGLDVLLTTLKKYGWSIGIASGGFTQLIEVLEKKYSLDMVRANTLEIKDGLFTGKVVGNIVNAARKAKALTFFARERGAALNNSICIGDGANDLLMLKKAGFAVAYHAKKKVQDQINVAFNYSDLSALALILETMAKDNG